MSAFGAIFSLYALKYSSGVGSRPRFAATAPSSAEPRNTFAPLPIRSSKLRVEVEKTVAPSGTRAWLPMQSEQPAISMRAPIAL